MAIVKVLIEGFTNAGSASKGEQEKTCPTISLVRDKNINIIVDPGVLDSQEILTKSLLREGLKINDINFVFITHSHIDHYRNTGMFPNAKIIEYFGIWDRGFPQDLPKKITKDIKIIKTPGHDYTSITLLVKIEKGIVAICGDVFWKEGEPKKDAYAQDLKELEKSRKKVLELSDWIIPGHGPIFKAK